MKHKKLVKKLWRNLRRIPSKEIEDDIDKMKSQKLQNHVHAFISAGWSGSEGTKTKTKMGVKREQKRHLILVL